MTLKAEFFTEGKKPTQPPDPAYPNGIDVDISKGKSPWCWIRLPKVETTGLMLVTCEECDLRIMITMAGRPDDARSYRMACRRTE